MFPFFASWLSFYQIHVFVYSGANFFSLSLLSLSQFHSKFQTCGKFSFPPTVSLFFLKLLCATPESCGNRSVLSIFYCEHLSRFVVKKNMVDRQREKKNYFGVVLIQFPSQKSLFYFKTTEKGWLPGIQDCCRPIKSQNASPGILRLKMALPYPSSAPL